MLKTTQLLNIFVETVIIFILFFVCWIESSKEQHLFEIKLFVIIQIRAKQKKNLEI